MARKSYEIAFDFTGNVGGLRKAFTSASGMVEALGRGMGNLKKASSGINRLNKLKEAIDGNVEAWRKMDAGAAKDRLSKTIINQQKSFVKLRAEVKGAGVDIRNLSGEEQRLASYAQKVRKAQDAMAASIARGQKIQQRRNEMRVQLLDAYALTKTLGAPIKQAMAFESAMADVRKVVDFDTPEQFSEMSQAILEMGRYIPMTHEGLAQIVAAGGQAGIARQDLTAFADDAAKMATAMDISAGDAGQAWPVGAPPLGTTRTKCATWLTR